MFILAIGCVPAEWGGVNNLPCSKGLYCVRVLDNRRTLYKTQRGECIKECAGNDTKMLFYTNGKEVIL